MTFAPANTQTSYLPPEQDFPEDEELLREILTQRERLTATVVNVKENAIYEKVEILTAQQWFNAVNPTINTGNIKQFSLRLTFDLVALNGGVAIPIGVTTLSLSAVTIPSLINIPTGLKPVHGFGGANNGTNFYFPNDPLLFVRLNVWTSVTQQIIITNNTGATLTQFYWCFEYIKT